MLCFLLFFFYVNSLWNVFGLRQKLGSILCVLISSEISSGSLNRNTCLDLILRYAFGRFKNIKYVCLKDWTIFNNDNVKYHELAADTYRYSEEENLSFSVDQCKGCNGEAARSTARTRQWDSEMKASKDEHKREASCRCTQAIAHLHERARKWTHTSCCNVACIGESAHPYLVCNFSYQIRKKILKIAIHLFLLLLFICHHINVFLFNWTFMICFDNLTLIRWLSPWTKANLRWVLPPTHNTEH